MEKQIKSNSWENLKRRHEEVMVLSDIVTYHKTPLFQAV